MSFDEEMKLFGSLNEGMSDDGLAALKAKAFGSVSMDSSHELAEEDEESDDIDKAIFSRLFAPDCPMSRETALQIKAMWDSAMRDESDSAEEKIIMKRKSTLLRFLSMKTVDFTLTDIDRAKTTMDRSHVGLERLKDFLLDEIASSVANGRKPRPLLLVGSPGCGKTSLAVSLASAFPERGHAVVSLSGKDAAFELNGVDQSWRACTFGLILKAFLQAGSLSPVIIFDELDKIGTSETHSRADSAFLDILQPERARLYVDALMTVPLDFSNAWYIFTANTLQGIPEPLLDRLSVFLMDSYDFDSFMQIAERMIAEINSKARCPLEFSLRAKRSLVFSCYGDSTSVRPLRQAIDRIYASKARLSLRRRSMRPLRVTESDVRKAICIDDEFPDFVTDFTYGPGVVSGIGVFGGRGYLLPVEVRSIPSGPRVVKVIGLVEQIMLESANIAYDLADSYAEKHLGENLGSVTVNYAYSFQKRGDSASLATAIAIISDLTGQPVEKMTAVTGAVSLKGNILPIGSVLAKITGAADQGADTVILPEANRKDVESVPSSLIPDVKLRYVRSFEEAVSLVFSQERDPLQKEQIAKRA